MSSPKRRRENLATSKGEPYNKRPRPDTLQPPDSPLQDEDSEKTLLYGDEAKATATNPMITTACNSTYGRTSGFSELNGLYIDHDYDEETQEQSRASLDYLYGVEIERSAIPILLIAPDTEGKEAQHDDAVYNSGLGDSRGRFRDGVYSAAPSYGPQPPHNTVIISPQVAYRTTLISRFHDHRKFLASAPPADNVSALPPFGAVSRSTWQTLIAAHEPNPVQIAVLKTQNVLTLLSLVTKILERGTNISRTQSAWIWSLMGKLGELGTLDNDGVSVVRQLGKRAAWVLCDSEIPHLATAKAHFGETSAEFSAEVVANACGNPENGANASEITKEAEESPDSNTLATIDMIITLVGECFGQRDLLAFREDWEKDFIQL